MFTINSYSDVVSIAKTFGVDALKHVVTFHTMTEQAEGIITSCMKWARSQTVMIEEVNDGNVEYSIHASFSRTKEFTGTYQTLLNDITIIRCGFGAYDASVSEAMSKGYIDAEALAKVINIITDKNEAAGLFWP